MLHAGFATLRPRRTGGDALLALARFAEESGIKGPPDLSRNIDTYLSSTLVALVNPEDADHAKAEVLPRSFRRSCVHRLLL